MSASASAAPIGSLSSSRSINQPATVEPHPFLSLIERFPLLSNLLYVLKLRLLVLKIQILRPAGMIVNSRSPDLKRSDSALLPSDQVNCNTTQSPGNYCVIQQL